MDKANKQKLLAAVFVAALLLPAKVAMATEDPPGFLPQALFGQSLSHWTAEWWQLMMSVPVTVNPLADETGDDCMVGQRGSVWFLAGNFGGSAAPTTRACTVSEGTALFFPVLNVIDVNTTSQTANELRTETAPCLDAATQLAVEVDGRSASGVSERNRVRSVVFSIALPADNLFGLPAGVYSPAIDDGYYVTLKPLDVGAHVVHVVGASAGCALIGTAFSSEVTYNLTVVPVTLH